MSYYQKIMEDARCSICFQPFTAQQWDDRHTASDGEDCHAECCDDPGCVQDRIDRENEQMANEADRLNKI